MNSCQTSDDANNETQDVVKRYGKKFGAAAFKLG